MKSIAKILKPNHLADLRSSGLNDETVVRSGIRSGDKQEVEDILGMKIPCTGGLVFPFFQLNGKPLMEHVVERGGHSWERPFCRVKPDYLPDHKGAKYMSPLKSSNHPYIVPGQEKALLNPVIPLHFTEGEKKSAALVQFGFTSIGLSGVWGWRTKGNAYQPGGGTLLPEFDSISLNNRKVFIIFDSDTSTNIQNRNALKALTKALRKLGAHAVPVILPAYRTEVA